MSIRKNTLPLICGALMVTTGVASADMHEMDHAKMNHGAQMGTTMVGSAAMYPSKNIVQNAVNSEAHTTLVAAVKAAGLVEALQGPGPYTVFAPTNNAFEDLSEGTVSTLLEPENKAQLEAVLLNHVVPGRVSYKDIIDQMLASNSGQVMMETLGGGMLTAQLNGDRNIVIEDANGNIAHISTYNVYQSNGVIHVVDHVLLP